MNDLELVRRAKGGDPRAFRELYDAHVDRVYRLAYRMTGEDDVARDITQETFLRVHQRLHQFRGDAAFSTWLHQVAVSTSLNGLRKLDRHRRRERTLESALHLGTTPGGLEPDESERLREAIDELPDIYRTVFLMHDLEGFSHGEIADALGVAEGTSKARLSRARAKLREALDDIAEEVV